MSKADSWQSKNPNIRSLKSNRKKNIFKGSEGSASQVSELGNGEKVGDGGEIVVKKNGRVLAGKNNNGHYCFPGRMKGLCPWLVLIGLTPLKLVEDWFTAAVILKLNPSPTGSFIIIFKSRKILTCVLFYSVT